MGRLANQADILVESAIRKRRPITREGHAIDEIESDVEADRTENQSEDGALAQTSVRRHLDSVRRTLTVRLLKPYRTEIVTNGGTRRAILRYYRGLGSFASSLALSKVKLSPSLSSVVATQEEASMILNSITPFRPS